MQSMLFPSILLTTVALLGFYLPPDSGERIGLQITILLTFMVFLLAVGEMFPASTGPYLGIYFVICMGLLGVNLLMTVIVLHVHFKPVVNVDPKLMKRKPHCIGRCRRFFGCNDSSDDEKTRMQKMRKKELYRTRSAVPRVTRKILQFCDRYWSVGEVGARWMKTISDDELDDVTVDDVMQDTDNSETMTDDDDVTWVDSRDEAMLKTEVVRTSANVSDKSRPSVVVDAVSLPHVVEGISVPSVASKKSEIDGFIMLQQNHQNNEAEISPEKKMETLGLKMPRKSFSNPTTLKRSISDSSKTEEVKMGRPTSSGRPEGSEHESRSGSIVSNIFRHRVLGVVGDVRDYIRKSEMTRVKKRKSRKRRKRERREKRKEEEQERQDLEQEEWKSVARAIDVIFFRFYVFFIVVSHVGLLAKALHSWLVDDRL
nr:uncharacterized protein LOC104266775 [Ciona intestinalis]|eukprot:XP_018672842.1 uncharacterized protein LOC104266775 [Ciona intestinalis]